MWGRTCGDLPLRRSGTTLGGPLRLTPPRTVRYATARTAQARHGCPHGRRGAGAGSSVEVCQVEGPLTMGC